MKPAAAEFGRLMRLSVDRSGMTATQVGQAVGVSRQMVREYMNGRIPGSETAARIADVLADPRLFHMAMRAKIVNCELCGREATSENNKRRYCSDACSAIARLMGRRSPSRIENKALTELSIIRAAVDDFCRRCEPDGICRTAACELRGASPLPLYRKAPNEIDPRLTGWSPERRLSTSERMKKVWGDAESRESRRAAISAGIKRSRAA